MQVRFQSRNCSILFISITSLYQLQLLIDVGADKTTSTKNACLVIQNCETLSKQFTDLLLSAAICLLSPLRATLLGLTMATLTLTDQ